MVPAGSPVFPGAITAPSRQSSIALCAPVIEHEDHSLCTADPTIDRFPCRRLSRGGSNAPLDALLVFANQLCAPGLQGFPPGTRLAADGRPWIDSPWPARPRASSWLAVRSGMAVPVFEAPLRMLDDLRARLFLVRLVADPKTSKRRSGRRTKSWSHYTRVAGHRFEGL